MLVSEAFAQAAAPSGGAGGGLEAFLPLILIFVVFYFLLIRPQQKRMKEHKALLAALRRGDRVVTGGGIIGTITKVMNDGEVMVEIAENVRVRVARETISSVLAKTEPVGKGKDDGDAGDGDQDTEPAAPPAKEEGKGTALGRLLGGWSK